MSEPLIEIRSALLGVGRARADAVLPRAAFAPGALRFNGSALELAIDGEAAQRFERSEVARGWFVPAFVERALGLAVEGQERPVVTTANYAAWLVLALRTGQWIAVSTADRDRAYALLDALAMGPSSAVARWEIFGLGASGPQWPPSREAYARTGLGAATGSAVLDAMVAYAGAWVGVALVTGAAVAVAMWGQKAFRQRISTMIVDPRERRATLDRPGESPTTLQLSKLEGVRFTRSGIVIEYEDAPRPIVLDVLSREQASRAIEGQPDALDRLRAAHTFAEWASRAKGAA